MPIDQQPGFRRSAVSDQSQIGDIPNLIDHMGDGSDGLDRVGRDVLHGCNREQISSVVLAFVKM